MAYTMVKYDVGHGSRLMDLPPVEEMDEQAPVPTRSPEETVGMDPVDDTPVVDASGEVVTDEGQSIEDIARINTVITLFLCFILSLPHPNPDCASASGSLFHHTT